MIDTRFVHPLGNIGNPDTFARLPIPVHYRTVGGASPQRVVRDSEQLALTGFLAGVAQGGETQHCILDNELVMDLRRSEQDVIDAALARVRPPRNHHAGARMHQYAALHRCRCFGHRQTCGTYGFPDVEKRWRALA